MQRLGGGSWTDSVTAKPVAGTGEYTFRVVVPDDATQCHRQFATRRLAARVPAVTAVPLLGAGLNDVVHDVAVEAPLLQLSGTLAVNGTPHQLSTKVRVQVQRAVGSARHTHQDTAGVVVGHVLGPVV